MADSPQNAATEPGPAGSFVPPAARKFVLVAAILASAMGFIDGSIVSIATPAIRANLGASLVDAQWISNAYLLFLSALLLLGGAVGDRFGLRRIFGAGIALFTLASIACALAPTPLFLIIARAVQGTGAAMMVPGSLAIIAKAYPKAERGRAIGIWASASSLTTILGPVVGGFLLTALGEWSWRLVFGINLPLGLLALALLFWRVPDDRPNSGRRLDVVGAALVTPALFALCFGLTGDNGAPSAAHLLLWGGVGLALLAAFLVWEARSAQPMLKLNLFRSRGFSGANGLTFALYFALAAISFYLPMTLISARSVSPAEVSLTLLPLGIMLTLMSTPVGRLADRFGPGPLIAGGSVLVALAFAGLGLAAPLPNLWLAVLPFTTLMGIGMGFVVSPLSTAVMTSVDDSDTGIASGVNNAVARVAGLLAVASMGSVVALVFAWRSGGGGGQSFGVVPPAPLEPAAEAVRIAATDGAFLAVALITAALSLVSAAIAWLTLERRGAKRA